MWLSGRTRPGVLGCGALLLLSALVVAGVAIKNWGQGSAGDYIPMAIGLAVASVLFLALAYG